MQKILKVFFTAILMSILCYASVAAVYAVEIDGLGTKASPYIIKNEQQLLALTTKELSLSAYYKLDNDISLVTRSWTPIGANDSNGFTGNFDGNGHKIANLNISSTTNSYDNLGLFAKNGGIISNLTVEAKTIDGGKSNYTGIIVGYNNGGTISNCNTSGAIKDSSTVGGIAGYNYKNGNISDCKSSYIIDESVGYSYVGGIVGITYGNITNCIFTGTLENVDCKYLGGIAAYVTAGDIINCGNLSDISSNYAYYIGGIIGQAESNASSINKCYNKGNITSSGYGNGFYIGGLIGDNNSQVENCFSIGNILSNNSAPSSAWINVSGLIGNNDSNKYVTNCYCIGTVTGTRAYNKDPFANGGSTYYSNCFYNQTKAGSITSTTAYGLTDTEMKDKANVSSNYTFWDFNTIWAIEESFNDGYPYLLSMSVPVSGITLSDTSVKLILGDKKKLTATVLPENATNKNIFWSTSDEGIASVDNDGNITANGIGSATITVRTEDGNFSAKCAITVVTENEADETAIFRIDDMSTIAGQRISVPLRLTKNTTGISTFGIDITYNNAVFKPVSVNTDNCQIFPDIISNINYSSDTIRITSSSIRNRTGSGIICYLEFDVAENAQVGSYDLKINVRELKTLTGNVQNDLSSIVYDGKIIIEDCVLGDVNGDGQISAADATEVLLNYAGLKEFSIKENTAADVDKNGIITANDATMILLKYAGYDSEW